MSLVTSLSLRWERAQHIDRCAIEPLGLGWYIVPSSRDPTGYAVHIELDPAGQLVAAYCTCPDFEKRAPDLHGVRACKHILAACLKARDSQPVPAESTPQTATVPRHLDGVTGPFPAASAPTWDRSVQEWVLTDSDGVQYFGATPSQCCAQFLEALHTMAQHVRRSPYGAEDLLDYRTQQSNLLPPDHLTRP
jgi:hypothetical protein